MMTLHPTKAQGATARPAPGLYVDPDAVAVESLCHPQGPRAELGV